MRVQRFLPALILTWTQSPIIPSKLYIRWNLLPRCLSCSSSPPCLPFSLYFHSLPHSRVLQFSLWFFFKLSAPCFLLFQTFSLSISFFLSLLTLVILYGCRDERRLQSSSFASCAPGSLKATSVTTPHKRGRHSDDSAAVLRSEAIFILLYSLICHDSQRDTVLASKGLLTWNARCTLDKSLHSTLKMNQVQKCWVCLFVYFYRTLWEKWEWSLAFSLRISKLKHYCKRYC